MRANQIKLIAAFFLIFSVNYSFCQSNSIVLKKTVSVDSMTVFEKSFTESRKEFYLFSNGKFEIFSFSRGLVIFSSGSFKKNKKGNSIMRCDNIGKMKKEFLKSKMNNRNCIFVCYIGSFHIKKEDLFLEVLKTSVIGKR